LSGDEPEAHKFRPDSVGTYKLRQRRTGSARGRQVQQRQRKRGEHEAMP